MKRIPLVIRKAPALPALFEQINQYLSSKFIPAFWEGGSGYSEEYEIVLGAPGGIPQAFPISLVYRPGQADEQVLDQGWRLPLTGPLPIPYKTPEPLIGVKLVSAPPAPPEPGPEPEPKRTRKVKKSEPDANEQA